MYICTYDFYIYSMNVSTSEKPTKWNVVENLVFIMFNKKFCPKMCPRAVEDLVFLGRSGINGLYENEFYI